MKSAGVTVHVYHVLEILESIFGELAKITRYTEFTLKPVAEIILIHTQQKIKRLMAAANDLTLINTCTYYMSGNQINTFYR